jgi:hypothetical protein
MIYLTIIRIIQTDFGGPLNLLSNGYLGLFPGREKRLRSEVGHSPQNSAEVRKTWIYTSTPLTRLLLFNTLNHGKFVRP